MSGKCFAKKWLLLTLIVLLSASTVFAEENITELMINSITSKAENGAFFDFSFSIGNRIGPPCSANIDYWLGTEDNKIVEGNDIVFLASGETKTLSSFLLIPNEIDKRIGFYLKMSCNGKSILASRPIKILDPVSTTPQITSVEILKQTEKKEFKFTYTLKSYSEESRPIIIEEKIINGSKIIWESNQVVDHSGTMTFSRHGPFLQAGEYTLTIVVTQDGENSMVSRNFDVGDDFEIIAGNLNLTTGASALAIALFAIGGTSLAFRFVYRKRSKKRDRKGGADSGGLRLFAKMASAEKPESKDKNLEPLKNYVCLVESESDGKLNHNALNSLLDEAGFTEEEKKTGFEFANKVSVEQKVSSSVFIDKFDNPKCETTVAITVSNNTGEDWCDVVIIAKIPSFLSEEVSEISADENLQVMKDGSITKFTVPKIDAMQSVSVVYSIGKWIPQEKVNLISLPAVINYKEGKPLVVKLKKSKKPVKSSSPVQIAEKQKTAEKKKRAKETSKQA